MEEGSRDAGYLQSGATWLNDILQMVLVNASVKYGRTRNSTDTEHYELCYYHSASETEHSTSENVSITVVR